MEQHKDQWVTLHCSYTSQLKSVGENVGEKERAMKIEGVPIGFELEKFGPLKKDQPCIWLDTDGEICNWYGLAETRDGSFPILRKIERPKTYRPFANAEEFKPHRDRWWRYKGAEYPCVRPPAAYSDTAHDGCSWLMKFNDCEFDDNTPFGVEVSE
jgi:hypothetical protein